MAAGDTSHPRAVRGSKAVTPSPRAARGIERRRDRIDRLSHWRGTRRSGRQSAQADTACGVCSSGWERAEPRGCSAHGDCRCHEGEAPNAAMLRRAVRRLVSELGRGALILLSL